MKVNAWHGIVPDLLYHGTSAPRFANFDLSISHGCVWFCDTDADARVLAQSFARQGRHGTGQGLVYKCAVRLSNVAAFDDEEDIYAFGEAVDQAAVGRRAVLTAAAHGLRTMGFDGMVDLYASSRGRLSPSFACFDSHLITIVSVN